MNKILFIAVLLLLMGVEGYCADKWTSRDSAYQLGYVALHVLDWGQTRDIAKRPGEFTENNFILGKHPSVGRVNTYFVATLVGYTVVAYFLPAKYRRWWQVVGIGVEGLCVANNMRGGIRVSF